MTLGPISIIGLGYIGLPTAAVLASRGNEVIGVDINANVVDTINQGKIHIAEPELDIVVRAAVAAGRLRATTRPEPASAFIIAVPTPFCDGYKPDLSYVESAAKNIAPVLQKGSLVVLESTSPVGTTERLAHWLAEARPDLSFPHQAGDSADVQVAYCPERVLPGKILRELVGNDRIVGGMSPKAGEMAAALYKTFVEGECIQTDARTAEMCKLAENTYRDINIAYANELSMICDRLGIDVWRLIALANRHPRVDILMPGPGVGGHCIAVDPWFIVDAAPEQARLIRAAREVNNEKTRWAVKKIDQAIAQAIERGDAKQEIRLACLGLAYKANVDDLRESPAVSIVQALASQYPGQVAVVEPHIDLLPRGLENSGVRLMELHEALGWANFFVVLVAHKQFMELTFDRHDAAQVIDLVGIGKSKQ